MRKETARWTKVIKEAGFKARTVRGAVSRIVRDIEAGKACRDVDA